MSRTYSAFELRHIPFERLYSIATSYDIKARAAMSGMQLADAILKAQKEARNG